MNDVVCLSQETSRGDHTSLPRLTEGFITLKSKISKRKIAKTLDYSTMVLVK